METKVCKHCQSEIPKKAKVCPVCRKKQGGKLKWVIIALVVLVIIGAAAGGGSGSSGDSENKATDRKQQTASSKNNDTKEKEEDPEPEPEPQIEYMPATVDEMMELLESNALKASDTYKGQYLEVTGKLSTIDSSGKYISLVSDKDYAIRGVQCFIKNDEQKSQVAEMTTGDTVTVRGKIKDVGEVLAYTLDIDEIVQ